MSPYQVGPFKKAEEFADSFAKMIIFNSAVVELMDWMSDVEAGLNDPTLPEEVKAQVKIDYNEIEKKFTQISGSMPKA